MLMLKGALHPRSRIASKLSTAQICLDTEHTLKRKSYFICLHNTAIRAHPHCVISRAIRKAEDRLETHVSSVCSGMDANDRRQALRGPSVWTAAISRAKWQQLFHCSSFTNAIMPSSLAGVRKVCGRPAFTSAVGVTLPLSRKRCPNLRGISASERRRPGQRSAFPVRQYLVDCHWHRKLKACCRIRRVHNA